MNVATLELCRELFQLSGWEDTYLRHWVDGKSGATVSHDAAIFGYGPQDDTEVEAWPAYDAGYLLRKLPVDTRGGGTWGFVHATDGKWYFNLTITDISGPGMQSSFSAEADILEDGLCDLAIELFKAGILIKGTA